MSSPAGSGARVCYASGTWQLITLCAALRAHHARFPELAGLETVVVFSGTGTVPALRRTLEQLGGLYQECHRFVWIDDLLSDLDRFDDREFEAAMRGVRDRIGVDSPAEVWVCYPWIGPDRFLLECYPAARVVLFEDGVLTYTRPWSGAYRLRSTTRETVRFVARRLSGDPRAKVRAFRSEARLFGTRRPALVASYLLLGDTLGIPAPHRRIGYVVDPAVLRSVLESIPVDRSTPDRGDGPRALVLGANFSAWNLIRTADELSLYAGIVRQVADAGYDVWWKDHPRVPVPFHPALQEALPDVTVHRLDVDPTLPLEAALLRDPVDLIVAGLSAGLFYTPMIMGPEVRAATFVQAFRPLLQWPWLDVADLIDAHVPTLDQVLAGSTATTRLGGNMA
jgi:hypothetical protein